MKREFLRVAISFSILATGILAGLKTGDSQLVSYSPMAVDPECDMSAEAIASDDLSAIAGIKAVASNLTTELAAYHPGLIQEQSQSEGDLRDGVQDTAIAPETKVKPDLYIRDPYAGFSAVYVDNTHDEVALADETNFNIMFFNRLENTLPTQELSKPKRSLGGDNTDIEYQSSLYVDPVNGDVYAANNDTKEKLGVFTRDQSGDVFPSRELATPYGAFGIAVDEQHQEMMLTIQHAEAIVTFPKAAAGHAAPIRLLQGNDTGLADAHGIVLDTKNDEMFVTNWGSEHRLDPSYMPDRTRKPNFSTWPLGVWVEGKDFMVPGSGRFLPPSITVYRRTASGDTPPLRTISGPKTQFDWPTSISIDPDRNELFVANDMGNSILVFKADAQGDVAPVRVLKGPKTLIRNPTGVFVDTMHQELWVANYGGHNATVYKLSASGDTAPIRVIRSAPMGAPVPEISNSNSLGFDTTRDEIIAPSCVHHPQIAMFDSMATGAVNPLRAIAGTPTHIARTIHQVAYDDIHDEIFVTHSIGQAIMVFRGAADGEEPPIRVIQGPHTQLVAPSQLAEDPVHNEIFVTESDHILVFPRDGSGDVAPIRVLRGPDTGLRGGDNSVAVDPIHNVLVTTSGGGLRIFPRTAEGNTKPLRVINARAGHIAVYAEKGEIFATTGEPRDQSLPPSAPAWYWNSPINQAPSSQTYVGVWSINDDGNVPPHFKIGGPDGALRMIHGVAIDPKHKSVVISDKLLNGILTYYIPDAF